jgi:uncharacterized protein (DUF2235 family)
MHMLGRFALRKIAPQQPGRTSGRNHNTVKNIIISCDGTNNQFSGNHTNVIRNYKIADGPPSPVQACYYDPGVGTMSLAGTWTKLQEWWSIIIGLAFGAGLNADIEEAYRYLMKVYEPGDRIFLFGFSRGAFTVRALAGMLNAVGLLYPDSDQLVPYARKYWQQYGKPDSQGAAVCNEFKATLARPCPVFFIGVWDTVSSVGLKNIILHITDYPFSFKNPAVTHVRHAVSIDERRAFFRQNLMGRATPDQDVRNVWFAGVHSDVGGGYPSEESGLSKLAYKWIVDEAVACGLLIDASGDVGSYQYELARGQSPDPTGKLHNSLVGGWVLAEFIPTRHTLTGDEGYTWTMNLFRRRDVGASAGKPGVGIHASVLERMTKDPTYRPSNLPGDVAGVRALYAIVGETPV